MKLTLAAAALALTLCGAAPALAQTAGTTTTTSVAVIQATQLAEGWSVKQTLMGKTVYNGIGVKVGNVEDLIISPERGVSYVIVGAGGFVGIGRHDVAIAVDQIRSVSGRLIMAGATQASIKAMPDFEYATDTTQRDKFVAAAENDIARGRATVADLEIKSSAAAADAKARLDTQVAALKADVKSADARLDQMKKATAQDWKKFMAAVNTATARLRKSIETPAG
ncbi:MAG: PRC-barrel domain-containing protein [Burkholderiaceae bacterium]|nr:PRC-barrel domain-containing protein [Burkholderiaceae bacterium]